MAFGEVTDADKAINLQHFGRHLDPNTEIWTASVIYSRPQRIGVGLY